MHVPTFFIFVRLWHNHCNAQFTSDVKILCNFGTLLKDKRQKIKDKRQK